MLSPFIDDILNHLCYNQFSVLMKDMKQGKHDSEKYTNDKIFSYKATLLDKLDPKSIMPDFNNFSRVFKQYVDEPTKIEKYIYI